MGRELPVGKPGPLRELFGQFPVGEVADDPRGVVRSQPVVAPGDMAAQLVVVRELAQVVGTGHRRTVQPRAAIVERRFGEPRREPRGGVVAVVGTVEHLLGRELVQIGRRVLARVVALEVEHRLTLRGDAHGEGRAAAQHLVGRSAAGAAKRSGPVRTGLFFQAEVQGRAVAVEDVAQRLDRLVVLHHLDAGHVLRGDVVRSQRVAAVEHVHPLDVELVDRFAVVADLTRLFDLDARHLAQHVGNRAVLRFGEARDVVAHRVAPQREARCTDLDLADLHGTGLETDLLWQAGGIEPLRTVAHHRDVDPCGPHPLTRAETEGAVRGRGRVTRLPARAVGRQQDGPCEGPSVGGIHNPPRQILCRCRCRKAKQHNKKYNPPHVMQQVIRARSDCSRAAGHPD